MQFLPLIILIAAIWYFYNRSKSNNSSEGASIGKILLWIVVGIFFIVPVNAILDWTQGNFNKNASMVDVAGAIAMVLVFLGISAGLGYYLIVSARKEKLVTAQKIAEDEQALQEMMAQPLTEIRPRQAILKTGEKAYGSVAARLQEVQTVGYSAGTAGVSMRVAKGLTVRTGGVRAHAVKGAVIVASGELVITDKRVLFAGDKKSFDILRDNILNVTHYIDGFGFHDSKKTYTLLTDNNSERLAFGVAVEKVLRGT